MAKARAKDRRELLKNEIYLPGYEPSDQGEPVALVYPNDYHVGMSSLGFLTVYRFLVEAGYKPERFFYDVRDTHSTPVSLESGSNLKSFTNVAFHFSFELDYVNAVKFLIESGLDPMRNDHQIRIAGGSCVTGNPLPIRNFFNKLFVGEIEDIDYSRFWSTDPSDENGWLDDSSETVKQSISSGWLELESFSPIITPNSTFSMMNLTEITRGCPIGCKFCLAGNLHGEVREKPSDLIVKGSMAHLGNSNRVGLIGASPLMHSSIKDIIMQLADDGLEPSLSSLNVASLDEDILEVLFKNGMRTLTLGLESYSRAVQKNHGKIIRFEKLAEVVKTAVKNGFREVKLYIMLGLPGALSDEENEVIEKSSELNSLIQDAKPGSRLSISINPFIPKAATPFARNPFMGEKEFRAKIQKIQKGLSPHGIKIKSEGAKNAYLQHLISLGDERMGEIILAKAREENVKSLIRKRFGDMGDYLSESLERIENLVIRC